MGKFIEFLLGMLLAFGIVAGASWAFPPKPIIETRFIERTIEAPASMPQDAEAACGMAMGNWGITCDGFKVLESYDRGPEFPIPGTTYVVVTYHNGDTITIGWLFHYSPDGELLDIE